MGDRRGRWVTLLVLGVLALALGTTLVLRGEAEDVRAAAATRVEPPQGRPYDAASALDVLHRWDAARSLAWSRGDVRGLRTLYVPHAPAGVSDVAMLRAYLARGLVVRDLSMQVLGGRLRSMGSDVVRVEVTERMAGGVAVADRGSRALPRASTATRVVELRRVRDRWRVASVEPGRAGAATDPRRVPP